jgi:hypothetical protein
MHACITRIGGTEGHARPRRRGVALMAMVHAVGARALLAALDVRRLAGPASCNLNNVHARTHYSLWLPSYAMYVLLRFMMFVYLLP